MYVYEKGENIIGSVIVNKIQPEEYDNISWKVVLPKDEVMVIHLLMVRPSMSGKGVASSLIKYAVELAKANQCKVLRLDTGSQNVPAVSLYQKNGFEIVARDAQKVGDKIVHKNHLYLEKLL